MSNDIVNVYIPLTWQPSQPIRSLSKDCFKFNHNNNNK